MHAPTQHLVRHWQPYVVRTTRVNVLPSSLYSSISEADVCRPEFVPHTYVSARRGRGGVSGGAFILFIIRSQGQPVNYVAGGELASLEGSAGLESR